MAFPKPETYRFIGREHADTIIGERVVMRVPLRLPRVGTLNNVSLNSFIKNAERQFIELMKKHGQDCADFELTCENGQLGVIFTRPMDVVERTQIRQHRLRLSQGKKPPFTVGDDDLIARAARTRLDPGTRLPDPSGAAPLHHAH